MTDEEIEVVAEELAKAGGTSWYPGRGQGSLTRLVADRYRAQARVVISTLERLGTGKGRPSGEPDTGAQKVSGPAYEPPRRGSTIIHRPPHERRAQPYRIVEIKGDRAYLAPILRLCVGWISLERIQPPVGVGGSDSQRANEDTCKG